MAHEDVTLQAQFAPVSVVIPCYRCSATIKRAVDSVAAQSWKPREIILVDDCSGDETLQRLQDLALHYPQEWVRVIALDTNSGPATARNRGWDVATQPYVAFLDSDDHWHPEKVRVQCTWMVSRPSITLSCHEFPLYAEGMYSRFSSGEVDFRKISKLALLLSNRVYTSTVMVERDIKHRFPERKRHSEDYLLWLNVLLAGNVCVRSSAPLSFRHKHAFGAGGLSGELWKMERGELEAFMVLLRERKIGAASFLLSSTVSVVKFARRLAIASYHRLFG